MENDTNNMALQIDSGTTGVQNAQDFIRVFDQVKKMAAKVLRPQNVISQAGKPYIDDNGCCAIANLFGIKFDNPTVNMERDKDEEGERLDYYAEGSAEWNGRVVHDIGSGSSRDEFFGQRKDAKGEKYWLPLSEIDRPSLRKKAITNLHARLTKRLMGLNYTWEELEQFAGIKKEHTGQVNYKTTKKPESAAQAPATNGTTTAHAQPDNRDSHSGKISEAQAKRLYAIAKGSGWTDQGIKEQLETRGYSSSKNIEVADYDEIVSYFQAGAK